MKRTGSTEAHTKLQDVINGSAQKDVAMQTLQDRIDTLTRKLQSFDEVRFIACCETPAHEACLRRWQDSAGLGELEMVSEQKEAAIMTLTKKLQHAEKVTPVSHMVYETTHMRCICQAAHMCCICTCTFIRAVLTQNLD